MRSSRDLSSGHTQAEMPKIFNRPSTSLTDHSTNVSLAFFDSLGHSITHLHKGNGFMKHALLTVVFLYSSLALSVFAQDQPKPDQNELTQPSMLKSWTGDLDGMIE